MYRGLLLFCLGLTPMSSIVSAADNRDRFEQQTFQHGETLLLYRLLRPKDYDEQQKYPLVIFLHGAGERGDDNDKQLVHGMNDFASDEIMANYPAFVMAPQCPGGQDWGGHFRPTKTPAAKAILAPALEATLAAAEALRKEASIDDERIYITGLSMGGYGIWDVLAKRPELFAAAAPICGGGNPAQVGKFKGVPIWAFHGAEDKTVPAERSREMIEALQAAGGNPKYTEYPAVGHDSWTQTYSNPELYVWLFAQRRK